jgi:hypothetical protein
VWGEKKDNNSLSNGFEIIAETKLCKYTSPVPNSGLMARHPGRT